jgi:hypothetical protein
MKGRKWAVYAVAASLWLLAGGCDGVSGPERKGEFVLSSQFFGTDSYYQFGYSYEESEFYKYPYAGESLPDIINEGFRVIEGGEVVSIPGFNTPGQVNGFALAGEFSSQEDAREFYIGYKQVEEGALFVTVSDTVKLHQVWLQHTSAGNYVKMLVKAISSLENESGNNYNEVTLEYTYQPDGSTSFPD